MKRVIVIAAIVLLLVGGSLGGLYMFMPEVLGLAPKVAEAPPPPPPPQPVKPTTVHLETVNLPVMIDGKLQRQVIFTCTIVVRPEIEAKATEELPRLRDAVINFGMSFFSEYFVDHPKMELPRLKATLLALAKRTLGDGVEDVLIQSYIEM